jgi:hypothetical protein
MRTHPLRRFALFLSALLAGCVMPQYGTFTRDVEVVGGQTMHFPFVRGLPIPAENNDCRVVIASMRPVGQEIFLLFSLYFKTGKAPQRVTVEDISGTGPELFVDDRSPRFVVDTNHPSVSTRTWAWEKGPLSATNWRPTWFHDPDETVRVYRFTVVTSDGRTVILYQPTSYTEIVKKFILQQLPDSAPKKTDSAEVVPM